MRVVFPVELVPTEPAVGESMVVEPPVLEPVVGPADAARSDVPAEFQVDPGIAANAVVTLLYADAGWRRDSASAQWKADVAAVQRRIAAGHAQAETLLQLRAARKAHPDARVAQLVDGLPP